MDQQRDTMNTPSSSHRAKNQTGFGRGAPPLPTLFELPDRSPEAIRAKQLPLGDESAHALHQPHIGPPAGHFDTPPGSGQAGGRRFPRTPVTENDASPSIDEIESSQSQEIDRLNIAATSDSGSAADRQATFGETSTFVAEATEENASWSGRAAMILLLMLMVTVAFVSGRGFHRSQSSAETDLVAGTGSHSQNDVEVAEQELKVLVDLEMQTSENLAPDDITSDFPPLLSDDPISEDVADNDLSNTDRSAEADAAEMDGGIQNGSAVASITPPTPANSTATGETPKSTDAILAEIEALAMSDPESSLDANEGIPEQRIASLDPLATDFSNLPNTSASQQPLPPSFDGPKFASDDLPSGMGDRLRLEQGIRYSQTPHAIGGFLDILKAWEAAGTAAGTPPAAGQ